MNKVIIMGRLAADPELRRTQSDIPVARFTVAVSRYSKENPNLTDWIDCVAWRSNAEFISKYFGKGRMILIEGSIKTGSYEDKNGNKRKSVDLLVDRAEFCGDKANSGGGSGSGGGFSNAYGAAPGSPSDPFSNMSTSFESGSDDDFSVIASDDDLPF